MKNQLIKICRLVVGTITLVVLAPQAFAQTQAQTQMKFDQAVACCWTGTPYTGCTTGSACSNGQSYCEAPFFYYIDAAFNKRYNSGAGEYVGSLTCGNMMSRGGDDDVAGLFVRPAPAKTSDGETLQVSDDVAARLRAETSVMELQRRGASNADLDAAISEDVTSAFSKAKIPAPEGVDIELEQSESGERTFTLRGEKIGDVVLKYDEEGKLRMDLEKQ